MTISERDYRAFVDFEKDAWVKLFPHYDSLAGEMTRQAVDPVLHAVDLRPGSKLLDVASGIGYVGAEAQRRGADALGVDFSSDMIDIARQQCPEFRIELGDAENLRYSDASFDSVVCAFGMLHFPRPGKALAEAHRVLRPGGRHAFTVWCGPASISLHVRRATSWSSCASARCGRSTYSIANRPKCRPRSKRLC